MGPSGRRFDPCHSDQNFDRKQSLFSTFGHFLCLFRRFTATFEKSHFYDHIIKCGLKIPLSLFTAAQNLIGVSIIILLLNGNHINLFFDYRYPNFTVVIFIVHITFGIGLNIHFIGRLIARGREEFRSYFVPHILHCIRHCAFAFKDCPSSCGNCVFAKSFRNNGFSVAYRSNRILTLHCRNYCHSKHQR